MRAGLRGAVFTSTDQLRTSIAAPGIGRANSAAYAASNSARSGATSSAARSRTGRLTNSLRGDGTTTAALGSGLPFPY